MKIFKIVAIISAEVVLQSTSRDSLFAIEKFFSQQDTATGRLLLNVIEDLVNIKIPGNISQV
jgi:hypothetical protein